MRIDGRITIWFNSNSNFKMEFNQVSIPEALEMLQLIRRNLQSVEPRDLSYHDLTEEQHEETQQQEEEQS